RSEFVQQFLEGGHQIVQVLARGEFGQDDEDTVTPAGKVADGSHTRAAGRGLEEFDEGSVFALLRDLLEEQQRLISRERLEMLNLEEVEEWSVAVGHILGKLLCGGQSGGNRMLLKKRPPALLSFALQAPH